MTEQRTRIVIGITVTMMVVEIAAGIAFGSMAFLADGCHMSTHVAAFLITALAYHFSRRHRADARYSFGTGKMGVLESCASAIVLAVIALLMAGESVHRFFAPQPIQFNQATGVAVIGLVVNFVCAWLLQGAHHHHHDQGHAHAHHHGHQDLNLRAAYVQRLGGRPHVRGGHCRPDGRQVYGLDLAGPGDGHRGKRYRGCVGLRIDPRQQQHPAGPHAGVTREDRYRRQVEFAFGNLLKPRYESFNWDNSSRDNLADPVEGGVHLLNHLPVSQGLQRADREIATVLADRSEPLAETWLWDTHQLAPVYELFQACLVVG